MRSYSLVCLSLLGVLAGVAPVRAELADVRIAEVRPGPDGEQWVELLNAGPQPVSLDGVWLASDNWVGRLSGLEALPPGGIALVHWNGAGTTGGRDLHTGPVPAWSAARGNLGLHRSDQLGVAAEMIAYVQWGQAEQPRSDVAEAAGLWSRSAFLPAVTEGLSLALAPGALGRAPRDWSLATRPTPGAVNAGLTSAWHGWSMLAGRAALEPTLSFDLDRSVLDLAAVDAGGALVHYRFQDGTWSPGTPLSVKTALPAALATSTGGTLELVIVGPDQFVYHNRLSGGAWSGFLSTGQQTAQPPALAYNLWARALELVIVGLDGQVLHNRFTGGQWGAWTRVGGSAAGPPALGVSSQESAFDLLFATAEQFLFRTRFGLAAWGNPEATQGRTRLRPAVAAGVGGNLEVVITGIDGMLFHNRYLAGRWRTWTELQQTSDFPPALVYNLTIGTLELVAVGPNQRLRHARFVNSRWTNWLPLGAVSATAPALVQSTEDDLELVVGGADGNLWHSRFRPRAEGLVSFSKEIQPIFTNQCATCHEGPDAPENLSLDADHAYDETVHTASRGRRGMMRVTPLDPDQSYLLHKVNGTHLEAGGAGSRMPPGGQLTQAEIDKLRTWIAQGALNN